MLIVDAHLDLAWNATRGRDPRVPAAQQPVAENEIATVGIPDLQAGGVGGICATIYCENYANPEEARQQAQWQLDWYRRRIDEKLLRIVTRAEDMPGDTAAPAVPKTPRAFDFLPADFMDPAPPKAPEPVAAVLLMEGADAIVSADDVARWHAAGLRIAGLARKRTRYAGSNDSPGPLTDAGRALVKELDRAGIIHDASHLSEQSFWQLLDLANGPVIASHSNCRAIVPGERQLSDAMIKAIAARGGVIGVNFFDKFLLPPHQYRKRRATLADVMNHVKHICDLAGSANHIGLGTDMDGGVGRDDIPIEIQTSADLPRVADALVGAGFNDRDVLAIMGGNWCEVWRRYFT